MAVGDCLAFKQVVLDCVIWQHLNMLTLWLLLGWGHKSY